MKEVSLIKETYKIPNVHIILAPINIKISSKIIWINEKGNL